jgi:hypothetical protein
VVADEVAIWRSVAPRARDTAGLIEEPIDTAGHGNRPDGGSRPVDDAKCRLADEVHLGSPEKT